MAYNIYDIRRSFLKLDNNLYVDSDSFVFSPDSTKITYTLYPNRGAYITNLLDGKQTLVSIPSSASNEEGGFRVKYGVWNPVFSPTGDRVAYSSTFSNQVSGDTAGKSDIFIKDLNTNVITRVSTTSNGSEAFGGSDGSYAPAFSPNGRKIVFVSDSTNLVQNDSNNKWDVFIKDLDTNITTRISVGPNGEQANNQSGGHWGEIGAAKGWGDYWTLDNIVDTSPNKEGPVFSPDGTKVAFSSYASNLVSGDSNGKSDIFVYDLISKKTTRISTDSNGSEAFGGPDNGGSFAPKFSPDGSKIVFTSDFTNLVSGDTNGKKDIFVKDLVTNKTSRISTSANGGEANSLSDRAYFSPDGNKVIFTSWATNITPFDENETPDIFIKDLKSGFIEQASRNYDTSQIFDASTGSAMSPDGKWLALGHGYGYVKDASMFYNPTIMFSSDDQIIRPTSELSPENLKIVFSKPVKAASGDIVIHNEDGSVARTIPVSDTSQVRIAQFDWRGLPASVVTANVFGLPGEKDYYATFNPGIFTDNNGNAAAGISDDSSLNFTIRSWGRSNTTSEPPVLQSSFADTAQAGAVSVKSYVPDGWASTHITMGQVWEGAPYSINTTLAQFDKGAYSNALGSYFTYFGTGFASDTRSILTPSALNTPKIQGLSDSTKQAGGENPVLVIYSNDFSTNESAANTVLDVSGQFAANQLANLALQAAAFEKQNIKNGITGSILFSPDGIGAMAKNLIYNRVSPNSDWKDPNAIIAVSGQDINKDNFTKTYIDYKTKLATAVDTIWALKGDPSYNAILSFPSTKPDVNSLTFSNDISDYLMAQAWIIKQFAPKTELATVTNLWAGPWSGAGSMLTASDAQIKEFAQTAADAYNTLGWQKANPYFDFIAFDKYERDETSGQVLTNQYGSQAFTETAWNNSLEFFNQVTDKIMPADKQAIMLWQIPASGLPSNSSADANMLDQGWNAANSGGKDIVPLDVPHFGITQSYFFGDRQLKDYGIAQKVADLSFKDLSGNTVKYGDRITGDSKWSPETGLIDPQTGAVDPLLKDVFAILWGGGNTSTPISYRGAQWSGVSGNSGATNDSEMNVKNKYGTAVLSIMDDLKAYDAASRGASGGGAASYPSLEGVPGLTQRLDLTGQKSDYAITYESTQISPTKQVLDLLIKDLIPGRNETFTTSNVERFHFDDVSTAFDLGGAAGQVSSMFDAVLNRAGDKSGLGYWIQQVDLGNSLTKIAQAFLNSAEGKGLASKSNGEFVDLLYTQGLERTADTAGRAFWLSKLDSGAATRADVAASFAWSAEQQGQVVSEVGTKGLDYVEFAW